MHIKSVVLKRFKRFHELKIELPSTAKLVFLAGPNGTGKSSLFDAFHYWHRIHGGVNIGWDLTYFPKSGEPDLSSFSGWNHHIQIGFHEAPLQSQPERRKSFVLRSAYRNDPQFQAASLQRQGLPEDEVRFNFMIENDAAVAKNYQRLVSQALEDVFANEKGTTSIGEFRQKVIGDIRDSMGRVFPNLNLNDLGNPLEDGTFRFDKGTSSHFPYKNLSGGEKAAFDLLLDFIVKARTFTNSVYCIDEPEAHLNSRVQGALLGELYRCLPPGCQLWLASHSLGMARRARDIEKQEPGSVAFLDFYDIDFDRPQALRPAIVNRQFWERILDVALDDVSSLVAPSSVILCEGTPFGSRGRNMAHDARCYDVIFGSDFPDAKFLAAGNSSDIESDRLALFSGIQALVAGCKVDRLIDRDDHSPVDVADLNRKGIRVLGRRHLQCYLYDDEVLKALCGQRGHPELAGALLQDKADALSDSANRGNPADDVKSASGQIFVKAKQRLSLTANGNDAQAFERNVLSPLLRPGMGAYDELKACIFEPSNAPGLS